MKTFLMLAALFILSASIAFIALSHCRRKYVRTHSKRCQRVHEINRNYQAYAEPIPGNENRTPLPTNTLAQLNNLKTHTLLMKIVKQSRRGWEDIILAHEEKMMAAGHYEKLWHTVAQLEEPLFNMKWYIRQKGFDKIAARLIADEKLEIPTAYHIHWDASYTSPAGRNHYTRLLTADINDIKRAVNECYKKQEGRDISPSMRFNIFKRDGYRCQLCGKTQADGVTLELDHKVPVAKGGTNAENNLWVLCFSCNRGKGVQDL